MTADNTTPARAMPVMCYFPVALFASARTRVLRPGSRPARSSRVHAALTALAFVLSGLFGLIHEATTTHVRCAQHGELLDGDPALVAPARVTGTDDQLLASWQEPDLAAVVRGLSVIALHGHEHCSALSATRQSRVASRPPAIAPAVVAVADLALAPPDVVVAPGDVLYRTAPKTSPPA
jgi:hypothetical protein